MRTTSFIRPLSSPAAVRWLPIFLVSLWSAQSLPAQTTGLSITTSSPLASATVGVAYSQTIIAIGAAGPFVWSVQGGLPPGLTLGTSSGVLSGTPTTSGDYSFTVQVTASSQTAVSQFALHVNASPTQSPLVLTAPTLFNAQIGLVYSATFSASGGTAPYTWSTSGSTDGLTIAPTTGILSGTPQAAGIFSFAVIVTDSAKATASQNVSLTVLAPSLLITGGASLASGTVGVAYDQKFSVVASGGTAPYTWSLTGSAIPGLTFNASTIELSGVPSTPGTYSLNLQVADSAGATASRTFSLTIAPAALTIVTNRQLASSSLNVAFSEALTASGGTPPYAWTANGLPAGLTLNASSGLLAGTPTAAGTFTPVITVTDSALNIYRDNFSLTVALPSTPAITISGVPGTSQATQQFPVQLTLASAFPAAIQGQLILSFQPLTGPNDSTIQFSTGGRTVNFNIPAGSTTATFVGSTGLPVPQLQIQTGTAAGSIIISLSNLIASGGVDITPTPAPSITTQIAAAAPVISSVQVIRNADSASGCLAGQLCVEITGYATSREVTQATFNFTAITGQTLQPSAGSISVAVSSIFSTWYNTSTMGSQFVFVQAFAVTASPANVLCSSVVLANRIGSVTANVNQ